MSDESEVDVTGHSRKLSHSLHERFDRVLRELGEIRAELPADLRQAANRAEPAPGELPRTLPYQLYRYERPTPVDKDPQPLYIPPHTPIHPNSPSYLYWDPVIGAVSVYDYINGWCAIAWIIRTTPGKGGSSLLAGLDDPKRLVSSPGQSAIDAIARAMGFANDILWQCKIALRLCDVFVLDASRLYKSPDGVKKELLEDRFRNGKAVVDTDKGGGFFDDLEDFLTNGHAEAENRAGVNVSGNVVLDEFTTALRKPCLHLFFVEDVEKKNQPDTDSEKLLGVGGRAKLGAQFNGKSVHSGVGIVESAGTPPNGIPSGRQNWAATIAHEIGHMLSLEHPDKDPAISSDPDNLMQPANNGRNLIASQCKQMMRMLEDTVAPACPQTIPGAGIATGGD